MVKSWSLEIGGSKWRKFELTEALNDRPARSGEMVLFRADASAQSGIGHVMRCLAVAQAWQDGGGTAGFITHGLVPALHERIRSEGFEVFAIHSQPGSTEDAAETGRILSMAGARWVFVDGYYFDSAYLASLRPLVPFVALVDDYGDRESYPVDVVVNPNVFGSKDLYSNTFSNGNLLAGLDYALVRREFRGKKPSAVVAPDLATEVLITMGGSDPDNVTLHLLHSLEKVNVTGLHATVVSGPASPHHDSLGSAVKTSRHSARLLVDPPDMPGTLMSSHVMISAAGGACAEGAVMGVPMLLTTIAENHARNAEEYAARQLAVSLGWARQLGEGEISAAIERFLLDCELRRRIAVNAQQQVDGNGALRVAAAMRKQDAAAESARRT
jgi:UDP-2,4-diacetamido-2,4,6-trideoxy-beta-L-altropyranose hydrolase